MSDIDTMNKHMVSTRGDQIAIQMPPMGFMSKAEAMTLAAWLVVLADPSDDHADFWAVLSAVEQS
jgi:hypothetical protein